MTFDIDAKKTLLKKIPHGLFICGVREGDEINGFTASWVTQGSFDPPLIVMAVRAEGSSHGIIQRTKRFSLNFLGSEQKELAAVFFKPQSALGGRFESAPFRFGELGLPLLENTLGGVECVLVGEICMGDHSIFAGEVKSAHLIRDESPLNLAETGWSYGG